jgi:hypothetical protein
MTPKGFEDMPVLVWHRPKDYKNAALAQVEIGAMGKQDPQGEQQQLF